MLQAQFITVDYSKLIPGKYINARDETDRTEGIDELAALIKSMGLIQPLRVRPDKGGKFEIVAGNRRHLAIGKLIAAGDWPKSEPVPVMALKQNDDDSLETSLVENYARRDMHPVTEFEVFAKLHAEGADAKAIAEKYGTTAIEVRQRLALGGMAPEVRAAWRAGKIQTDVAMVFAACTDTAQQAKAYAALKRSGQYLNTHSVRQYFVKDRPRINDPRVAFVGIANYKAAGGKVQESLFEGDGFLLDAKLFDKLVAARIEERCAELVAAGWKWALPIEEVGHAHYSWGAINAKPKYLAEERARLREIAEEIKDLEEREELSDAEEVRKDYLTDERNRIEAAAHERGFSAEDKAKSGCIVEASRHKTEVTFGKVKNVSPAKLEQKQKRAKETAKVIAAGGEPEPEPAGISNALHVDITAAQTTALAEALAQCPAIAIRVLAAALTPTKGNYAASPVRVTVDGMTRSAHWSAPEDDEAEEEQENEIPSTGFGAAFAAISERNAPAVLAVNLGRALDVRAIKYKLPPQNEIDALVAALPGSIYLAAMRNLFKAEDYFSRASAKIALAAIDEMHTEGVDRKAKKPALAAFAAADAIDKGWLPPELRHPDYALLGPAAKKGKRARVAA